jgi:hypothetical protein
MKYMSKYKELSDKDWLFEKYIIEAKSITQISKLIESKYHQVRFALIKHKIPIRTKSEGQRLLKRSGEDYFVLNQPIIEGGLLGDAGLKKENKISDDCYPFFSHSSIHYEYAVHISQQIFQNNWLDRIKEREQTTLSTKPIFRTTSLTHKELLPFYKRWYPEINNYKKLIPHDLQLSKDLLLHWFLDDGYSYRVKKGNYRYVRIQFATQSFEKSDLDYLYDKILIQFGLKIYPRLHQRHGKIKGTGYHMELSQSQNVDFFDLIGESPVSCFDYKWKYRR